MMAGERSPTGDRRIFGFVGEPAASGEDTALAAALARLEQLEIARFASLAIRLTGSFGPLVAASYLCHEILDQPPDPNVAERYSAQLAQDPSAAREIATALARRRRDARQG